MLKFWFAPVLLAVFFGLQPQCADQFAPTPTPTALPDSLDGGVVAEFETPGGTFHVFTTEPSTIEDLYNVQSGQLTGVFPSGVLVIGSGAKDHNSPWSWHLHRQTVRMVTFAPQICDRPLQEVEDNLENWLKNVQRFCPREATLVSIADYR